MILLQMINRSNITLHITPSDGNIPQLAVCAKTRCEFSAHNHRPGRSFPVETFWQQSFLLQCVTQPLVASVPPSNVGLSFFPAP